MTDGLVVFYPFTEGNGTVVGDQSPNGPPMDLEIQGDIGWAVGENGVVCNGGRITSFGYASKVIDALQATSLSTFEAWVVPADLVQSGPARIVSVGRNLSRQNFVLGQMEDDIQVRLLHTAKDDAANPRLTTTDGFLTTELTHLVHTYDGAVERLYVNGVEHPTTVALAGDYSNWAANHFFNIGNEATLGRPWYGVIRIVAVYDRALSPAEIVQNFEASPIVPSAPSVDAGPDIYTPPYPGGPVYTVTLLGSVLDDGLPDPPGAVSTEWSVISGPGSVVFDDPFAPETGAEFSDEGVYLLELTADDGFYVVSDQVTVSINIPPSNDDSFTDITDASGTAGPSTYGGHGAMWADLTADDLPDLYVTRNKDVDMAELFFRNVSGYSFVEEAALRGIDDFDAGTHGAAWGDLDNDGDYDLVNGGYDRNRVFENDGTGNFLDRTIGSGFLDVENGTRGALLFDFDLDGDLDVFFNNWGPAGEENEFYRNEGNFVFTPIDNGLQFVGGAQGVTAGDFDNDGDPDLLMCHWTGDSGPVMLFRNDAGTFNLLAVPEFAVTAPRQDGVTFCDVNNDGWLDVHVTVGTSGTSAAGYLFMNSADGATFTAGPVLAGKGFMGGFEDLDNDGDWDIVYAGAQRVFLNAGDATFTLSSAFTTGTINDPRAVAFADIDADGDRDFYYAQKKTFNRMIRNDLVLDDQARWLGVELVSVLGQAGAFGAKVKIYEPGMMSDPAGLIAFRQASSQDGYLAQHDPVLHFGLANRTEVDLEVVFQEGVTATQSGVAANQVVLIDASTMPNGPPEVDAGPDQATPVYPFGLLDSVTLSGSVEDDGLPFPPGQVTTTWSMVSGPGAVAFGDDSALQTSATFSADGTYVLQLAADDGELVATDQVTVTVNVQSTTVQATNLYPADAATGVSTIPTLELVPSPGTPVEGRFVIAADAAFTSIVYDSGDTPDYLTTHVALADLDSLTEYHWSARLKDDIGLWSAWSTSTAFTTIDESLLNVLSLQDGVGGYVGTADADIRGDFNDPINPVREWNQGAQDVIRTGRRTAGSYTDEIFRSLLRFDLTGITDPDAVVNVYLELTGWQHDDTFFFKSRNSFYKLLTTWGEGDGLVGEPPDVGEVSWTYSEFPTPWDVPGVAGIGTDREGTPLFQAVLTNQPGYKSYWSSQALVDAVRLWIAQPTTNHGIFFKADDESYQHILQLASHEHTDPSFRPRLVIITTEGDECLVAADGTPCDDGLTCTDGDTCSGGVCTAGPTLDCNDALDCTTDTCDEQAAGCVHELAPDACLIDDVCYNDGDLNPANDCEQCDLSLAQTAWSPLDPGVACGDPTDDDCTDPDTCDGAGVCLPNHVLDGTVCDDALFCNEGETCTSGVCGGGSAVDCDDGLACTADSCDESGDACLNEIDPGACVIDGACYLDGDSNPANDCELCDPLLSQTQWSLRDAGSSCGDPTDDDCTDPDTCDGAGVCLPNHVLDGSVCDDGLFCNEGETCTSGVCGGGAGLNCGDGLACTTDSCDESGDACLNEIDPGAC
ncbi:MAG: VCBS repeat-containing protein, partial [Phycisphaerales bacterium]